jgi:hypothetical protein
VTTKLKSASREDNTNPESSKMNMKETNDSQLGRAPKKGKKIANKGKMMVILQESKGNFPLRRKGSQRRPRRFRR